jgi:hypothetical protein
MTAIGEVVVARTASADCQWLLAQAASVLLVLPLLPVYPLPLPVSRQRQKVMASALQETVLISLPAVFMARYETYRNKPTLRESRAQLVGLHHRQ